MHPAKSRLNDISGGNQNSRMTIRANSPDNERSRNFFFELRTLNGRSLYSAT